MLLLWRKQRRKAGEFEYGQSMWDVEDSQQDQWQDCLEIWDIQEERGKIY